VKSIPVRTTDGRVVGHVTGPELTKTVRKSKHQLHSPPAWASDADVLQKAFELGAREVVLLDKDDGTTWRAPITSFWNLGFPVRRGHGHQIGLPLHRWEKIQAGAPRQLPLISGN